MILKRKEMQYRFLSFIRFFFGSQVYSILRFGGEGFCFSQFHSHLLQKADQLRIRVLQLSHLFL